MGLFDGLGDSSGGGLMGMYANPQAAALLGMSQGLLSAAGPSRIPVSMGQAMGAGLQGAQQGIGNAMQAQRQLYQMQAMQGLMGMAGNGQNQAPSGPAPQMQPAPAVTGPANVPGLSGLSSGMGSLAPTPGASAAAAASAYPAATQSGPLIYGKTPQQLFQQGMLMTMAGMQGGGDLMRVAVEHDPTLAAQMPTDITRMGAQAGMTPDQIQAANAGGVSKATYIAPLNSRPGTIVRNPLTMQPMAFNPNIPTGSAPLFDASGNVAGMQLIPGATGITSAMAAAKAGGEGSVLPYSGVDRQGNPLPITNRTAAATQGAPGSQDAPAPLRNNNPGALMPGGKLAQYPDMQTGLSQLDANLQSYGQQGVNTLSGVISKWAPPSENNTQAYIQDVSQRLGIKPDQPVDLTNPAQRQAISTAIMLHENGPGAVFSAPARSGAAAPGAGGPMYAAAPLGATTAANTSQGAPSKQMADAYGSLSSADANYQQSREALTEMLNLANNKGVSGGAVGLLPEAVATKISPDAATYQKAHATFVALQGKALGSGGTDAARATIDEAVPTYDKPQSAMVTGLNNQLNNLDLSHIKTQFLTPIYQQGDEKAFTQQSAAFDQNVKPSIVPLLTMAPGPQRAAALTAAIKQNPSIKSNLNWAVQNGLMK